MAGRRGVQLEDEGRWVFNRLAADYAARPPYPAALVERLAALAGGPGGRVADLGAGTGLLALPLAAAGLRVHAVEPARAMLDVLAAADPGGAVARVHAAAEAAGLPDAAFELALFADAVHWVDPELAGREAGRLLAPGAAVAVVEAAFAPTPFMEGLTALLTAANPRARRGQPGAARQVLALASGSAAAYDEPFTQAAPLDADGVAALVRSLSYAGPALGPSALARIIEDAQALAARVGEARFARDLTLRWARKVARG